MRISACVITKNEEENLPAWLACMADVADEMVVVDTGSGDRTVEIARAAGARVELFSWVDDFSAAKNFALDQATGDWVFFLDADEYFLPKDCPRLRETIRRFDGRGDVIGLMFLRANIEKATGEEIGCSEYVIRCFRRMTSLRYVGRIHEELRNLAGGEKKVIQQVERPIIYHTGYSSVVREAKFRRNIRLLEKSQALDGPREADDVYFMDCHYGMGEYEKAIIYARRAIRSGVSLLGMENRPYSVLIHSLMEAKHPAWEIREAILAALERYPKLAEYWLFYGILAWEQGEYEDAERYFRRGMELSSMAGSAEGQGVLAADNSGALLPFARECMKKLAQRKE